MLLTNIPAFLCFLCISIYWSIVFIKAILITSKIGKTPNIIPKEFSGYLSRFLMIPLIVMWLFLPWNAAFFPVTSLSFLANFGVFLCLAALVGSIYCWWYMGNVWRIGIDPAEKTQLLSEGPFKYVRHPIYALSILLMSGTFLTLQSPMAFFLLCFHWVLFYWEAFREEQYLKKIHDQAWCEYAQYKNRFLPSLRTRRR